MRGITRGILAVGLIAATGTGAFAADDPKAIAQDFCYALAAQASCKKVLLMPKDTESRLEAKVGGKLRGAGSPLDAACNEGYSAYYALEDGKGLDEACATVLGLYGEKGSRRVGLVAARSAPAGLKLADEVAGAMAGDLCYAAHAADNCPDLAIADGVEARLNDEAGVALRAPGGYFSGECGSGTFKASLARGKVPLPEFCAASLALYGPEGSARPGLLTGRAAQAAAKPALQPTAGIPENPSTAVFKPPKIKIRSPKIDLTGGKADKPAAPRADVPASALTILTDLPPLPAGRTAADLLGGEPGTLDADACAALAADLQQEAGGLGAGNLANQVRAATLFSGHREAAASACPGASLPAAPVAVVDAVAASGLEACHLVIEADKALEQEARALQRDKALRQAMGTTTGRVAMLEAFAPTCSDLTRRQLDMRLGFAQKQAERDRDFIGCRLWQDRQREEMTAVGEHMRAKQWVAGIARLDGTYAAVIHGMTEACGSSAAVDSTKKYWLTQRKFFQDRIVRQ